MSDDATGGYTPTWALADTDGSTPQTPPADRYGDGVGFHDPDPDDEGDDTDDTESGGDDTDDTPPDTPEWGDDSRQLTRADFSGERPDTSGEPVETSARAVYQSVDVPHPSAFYQLAERHGLHHMGTCREKRVWRDGDGLRLFASGKSNTVASGKEYLSYLTVRGPADAVAAFCRDLLAVVSRIKRELRAPSLTEHADAAQDQGVRVSDENRLVGRGVTATAVVRPPGPPDTEHHTGGGYHFSVSDYRVSCDECPETATAYLQGVGYRCGGCHPAGPASRRDTPGGGAL